MASANGVQLTPNSRSLAQRREPKSACHKIFLVRIIPEEYPAIGGNYKCQLVTEKTIEGSISVATHRPPLALTSRSAHNRTGLS